MRSITARWSIVATCRSRPHPSTLLGMALSIAEGAQPGHASTSKPKLRRIHSAHDDAADPEDAGAGRAAAGATGSVAGRRMAGGALGSLTTGRISLWASAWGRRPGPARWARSSAPPAISAPCRSACSET